jgi:hypothetical protein
MKTKSKKKPAAKRRSVPAQHERKQSAPAVVMTPVTLKVYPHVTQVHTAETELTEKRILHRGDGADQKRREALIDELQAAGCVVSPEYLDAQGNPLQGAT